MPPENDLPLPHPDELAEAVRQCRRDARFLVGLRDIYRRLDAITAHANLACRACGACCRFDQARHRLYLSTGELAFLARTPQPQGGAAEGCCPYQVAPRCTARVYRALGCRVYFCEAPAGRCEQIYERFHNEVRSLHRGHNLPYRYLELLCGLNLLASGSAA